MYFDHSATHPINKKVLKETLKSLDLFYNSNSTHQKGYEAKEIIQNAENFMLDFFHLKDGTIIFTSGASESNNMVILGLGEKRSKGNIIISPFEHSSVLKPISYLQHLGHQIKIAPVNKDGTIKVNELLNLIDDDTFLVTISACESEIGIQQDINTIAAAIKNMNPNTLFHSDITQAINKYKLSLEHIDFASFSGHKFGSLKGIGGIINNSSTQLKPIMYGSDLKPGTKPVELIHNMNLALQDIDYHHQSKIKMLNTYLRQRLKSLPLVTINTPSNASPYILNISVLKYDSRVTQALLNQRKIYVSTQSACAHKHHSESVYQITHSIKTAQSSIRISLSPMHTIREINLLLINLERLCQ